jgi:hypothetical protein
LFDAKEKSLACQRKADLTDKIRRRFSPIKLRMVKAISRESFKARSESVKASRESVKAFDRIFAKKSFHEGLKLLEIV